MVFHDDIIKFSLLYYSLLPLDHVVNIIFRKDTAIERTSFHRELDIKQERSCVGVSYWLKSRILL